MHDKQGSLVAAGGEAYGGGIIRIFGCKMHSLAKLLIVNGLA